MITLTTNHLNEVKDWVLSWGGNARVILPSVLLDRTRAELEDALKQYGSRR